MRTRALVLDNVRVIDGTGAAPVEKGRIVIDGDRIAEIGPRTVWRRRRCRAARSPGQTLMPGLIDLHYHVEDDPKLALRQLSDGVTSFRDPGQWKERFDELSQMMAADGLPGPRLHQAVRTSTASGPAYPADSIVARDAEEARRPRTAVLRGRRRSRSISGCRSRARRS